MHKHPSYCVDLGDAWSVMTNVYDMPHQRLCIHRFGEYAAAVWERAGTVGEQWLRRRVAITVSRPEPAFRHLSRPSMMDCARSLMWKVALLEGRSWR